jgi:hypothetical protein
MPTGLWRVLAIASAIFALLVTLADAYDWQQYTSDGLEMTPPAAGHGYATIVQTRLPPQELGELRPGDRIRPLGRDWSPHDTISTWPAGTLERWTAIRGTRTFHATTLVRLPTPDDVVFAEIVNAFRLAMISVALLVAVRRPDAPEARALVTFLTALGLGAFLVPGWLPDWALAVATPLRGALLMFGIGYATLFGCVFPRPATGGIRGLLRRIIVPLTAVLSVAVIAIWTLQHIDLSSISNYDVAATFVAYSPFGLLALMLVALIASALSARGPDRVRVLWASGSVIAGFSGVIAYAAIVLLTKIDPAGWRYIQLTLVLMPIGLAYTILRHRTIDIGFVISRALVLTVTSFVVVAAFGLLERALGKIFIDASHVASRGVEIALALGLGFSLRTLHARIEQIVDGLFFRRRRQALAQLRAFAADVGFITDPDVTIERTIEVAGRAADAADAALYLIADGVYGRSVALEGAGFPAEISADDPLLVRLRSTRKPEALRGLGSGLDAEIAFPLFVRGTLVGALVLAAKRTGETYDPEETALLANLAQQVAIALDALQTLALRREFEALVAADRRLAGA